ncbi:MAG TPA: tyrosine--tRNA ligase [Candidatus Bathyarchaeia archaeon]|nr:tyrosine--tRNA ligase [Candidatus Bathyarchaeia archaeon]
MNPEKAYELICAGAAQVTPQEELLSLLKKGQKLKVKLGMDPTAPDLHLGHAVVLSKMRTFQDLGHDVIFLIGDFTARIGDPTGRSKMRPPLSGEDIVHNMHTYFEQVGKILDTEKAQVRYNSHWLDALSVSDMIKLCAKTTLARLTEREDFAVRIAQQQPIGFHELLYPLFQGYDSVALEADVELGGTDQTFNLLYGRFLQEHYGQRAQIILTMPLLEGLDGQKKMSKSLGNAIGLNESAEQMFGKLMSISDDLMWRYYLLLLPDTASLIEGWKEGVKAGTVHPMELKKNMAYGIVKRFWPGQEDQARAHFQALFQKKDYAQAEQVELQNMPSSVWIVDLIKALGAAHTSSDIKRLIEAGAVQVDDTPIIDFKAQIPFISGMIVKVGKHKIYCVRSRDFK